MTPEQRIAALEQQVLEAMDAIERVQAELDTLRIYQNAMRDRYGRDELRGGGSPYRVGIGRFAR